MRTLLAMLAVISGLLAVVATGCTPAAQEPLSRSQQTPASLRVGDPAPLFTLPASDGSTVALSQYRGEAPVLLYFHMAYG